METFLDRFFLATGGSLFLFDRKTVRYFRKDGHNWRKKADGKTVRETHEKLKVLLPLGMGFVLRMASLLTNVVPECGMSWFSLVLVRCGATGGQERNAQLLLLSCRAQRTAAGANHVEFSGLCFKLGTVAGGRCAGLLLGCSVLNYILGRAGTRYNIVGFFSHSESAAKSGCNIFA